MKIAWILALPLAALAQAPAPGPGVDASAMNAKADPCADFYQYACGNWIAAHPLPADRARYGRFEELQERNEKVVLGILQGAAAARPGRSELEQKIGDYYASCMDTATIAKRGIAPIKEELARLNAIEDGGQIADAIVRLHRSGVGGLFAFGARADGKDSSRTIAGVSQGGLSLPERDYYLKEDAKSVEIRKRFVGHVAKMFQLAGDPAAAAAEKAALVMDFETTMARAFMDRRWLRDPKNTYNVMTRRQLAELSPFEWDAYFQGVGAPAFETLNVAQPETFQKLAADLRAQPLEAWRAYLSYQLLRESATELPQAFEDEYFDFWQRYLAGVQKPRPREVRCAIAADRMLGDLLGQKYIEAAFPADAREQINSLVDRLEKAMAKDIETLPWMTGATKKAALEKLQAIVNNVGYPKKWRDYSKVAIARDDFYGNTERAAGVLYAQRLEKIGKPTDRTEWNMTVPTVNAFYQPANNSINFPAGILQTPFFDPGRDMAVNYGGIGVVIGHEMTHGFDDSGRKYDANGNLRDWWTPEDGAAFEKRAACFVDQYSAFTAIDDVKLDGKATLGENVADAGGMRLAYTALQDAFQGKEDKAGGFTPEQRMFIGFAQVWCQNISPQEARNRALTDPHSPGRYRVNGTLQNTPEFQKAFSCKAGQPMVSANVCRAW